MGEPITHCSQHAAVCVLVEAKCGSPSVWNRITVRVEKFCVVHICHILLHETATARYCLSCSYPLCSQVSAGTLVSVWIVVILCDIRA